MDGPVCVSVREFYFYCPEQGAKRLAGMLQLAKWHRLAQVAHES